MKSSQNYIIFPLDVSTVKEAARYIDLLSDSVGLFKVGLELFVEAGPEIIRVIKSAGSAGIFLDLKFHDIPMTVERAMGRVAGLGVKFATVHCGETSRMLEAAVAGGASAVGVLGVTVLTSISRKDIASAGFKEAYSSDMSSLVRKRAEMAKTAGCAGVVCSGHEVKMIKEAFGKDFCAVTPGIRPAWQAGNDDQRRIVTPAAAVKNGSDYLVIGRPIRDAKDPAAAAKRVADEIDSVLTDLKK
ncbi:MAG: orotidine-5'-phosphate decarboxylase [Desulfobacteraceae bacterium]|nr:orotidine-5'-phosphate decarboxylase [Desulfobacteraceae bacterium]MBC2754945.1 orotidine-5'-phosphate decarboxylase [Desulfobacteraceae bacterium]